MVRPLGDAAVSGGGRRSSWATASGLESASSFSLTLLAKSPRTLDTSPAHEFANFSPPRLVLLGASSRRSPAPSGLASPAERVLAPKSFGQACPSRRLAVLPCASSPPRRPGGVPGECRPPPPQAAGGRHRALTPVRPSLDSRWTGSAPGLDRALTSVAVRLGGGGRRLGQVSPCAVSGWVPTRDVRCVRPRRLAAGAAAGASGTAGRRDRAVAWFAVPACGPQPGEGDGRCRSVSVG